MKVSSRINVEIVMVCRSSNHLAFLMSESGLCCDLSTATVRNIATTRVKVSSTRILFESRGQIPRLLGAARPRAVEGTVA